MRNAQQAPTASSSPAGSAPRIFGAGEVPLEPWEQQRAMALMLAEEAQWKSDARLAATAEPELQAVATKLPDDVLLLDALALVNVMLGRGEQATRHWKRALALEPHQQDVLYALAAHYQKSGELAQSREYLERFLDQNKSRADMFGRYSFLLAQQGEVDRAIEVALQGLELDPSLARLYEWLIQLYDNQGMTAEAEKYRAVLRHLAPPPGSGSGE
jgi:tetratricopeptide (TPR) repeat protein